MSDGAGWHQGACHCGGVQFRARLPEELRPARCSCSICAIKGIVMIGVPLADFELLGGEDLLTLYQFNTGAAKHWFCSICGIYTHHQRRSDPSQYGVNAACLEGMSPYDFAEVPVIDGINHPRDNGGKWRIAGVMRFDKSAD